MVALLSAFAALWGVQYVGTRREKTLVARVDSLRDVLDRERASRAAAGGGGSTGARSPDGIDPSEIEELRHAGLADPVRDLKRDLMKHPELIPYPGVEGGTMGFYSDREIGVLGPHWVMARFEDGHVGGSMLLEYQVRNGRITWRRLAASRD